MTDHDWLDPYRRVLQLTLGLIWLLDAALQFQPYMFTEAFPRQVLAPVGNGNPVWIAGPVQWATRLTAAHVVTADAVFATVQLLIALGLFTPATVRVALAGSVIWALGIWWLGEGLGGMLAAPQSPIMGAPGAAVIYALLSILIWPRKDTTKPPDRTSGSIAGGRPGIASRLAWLVLWGSFAFESVQAPNRSPSALHDLIAGMPDGEPTWLQTIDRGGAAAVAHHGTEVSIALAILFALIALSVLGGISARHAGVVAAVLIAAIIWVVGENLGEIATGQATDPNTGPLLMLLAAAYWPRINSRRTATEPASSTAGQSAQREPVFT